MTRDEIITALRCVAVCGGCDCTECESRHICSGTCVLDQDEYFSAAADLIENQQRHIEALMKANAALRDTVLRRDAQIEKMATDCKALINELCQYCGKYKQAHNGACDGCRWREM